MEEKRTLNFDVEKKDLLKWGAFFGVLIITLVLGDSALPHLPVVSQAVLLFSLVFLSLLYLYSIEIEGQLELKLGVLAVSTLAYGAYRASRLAIDNVSPMVVGALALALVVLLLGYVFYPFVGPRMTLKIEKPKPKKRRFLPQFKLVEGEQRSPLRKD